MTEKKVCWNCRFCKMDIRDGKPYCSLRERGGKCYAYDSWESQEDVLDKIYDEVSHLVFRYYEGRDTLDRKDVLQIIKNYKTESEK